MAITRGAPVIPWVARFYRFDPPNTPEAGLKNTRNATMNFQKRNVRA